MKQERMALGWTRLGMIGALLACGVVAVALPQATTPERVRSVGHTYFLPPSAEISRTLLPDGRVFEMHGADGVAYLLDGKEKRKVALPEHRRFASVTVMPGGQVLVWGGIDDNGEVFPSGQWLDPARLRFVQTGVLGLPARAGHTLTVLSDGSVLMSGGWNADGNLATSSVVWQPKSHELTALAGLPDTPRLNASTVLQSDGSVQILGGVDGKGLALGSDVRFDSSHRTLRAVPYNVAPNIAVGGVPTITVLPDQDKTAAPITGPIALRFNAAVDVSQLTKQTITLLGPEGVVPVRVVGTNEGRQAFVQLPDDLYPGSRYTLFVKGLHTAQGAALPYTAVGFTTAHTLATTVVMAGQGESRAPSQETHVALSNEPPLVLMAGNSHVSCAANDDQLCRGHSFVRDGAFYPGKNNAPDATGAHWRLYAAHQSLPDVSTLEAQLPKGATVLIGQVRQIDETPVANVEVSIGDNKVRTDDRGVFMLKNLSAGRQEVFIDGGTADHDDMHYGRFLVGADVRSKTITHMPFVMYLPRILPRDEVTLPTPTNREVVLTHPDMPGLELHVPAGAVFKDRYGHVLTHIAIVPTPVDHAPFPLPDNFPMYFTIQPGDAVIQGLTPDSAKGIRVVYPNYGHDKANAASNFWVYSAKDGWQMYGGGRVTADAKHIAPNPGVSLVWAMGAGVSLDSPVGGNAIKAGNKCTGEPIDDETGTFFHEWSDMAIKDVMPLTLGRAYNSADNTSHVFGVGGNSNLGIHLYGSGGSFTTPELVLPCGQVIAFNLVSGNPANYPLTGVVWEHTGTASAFYGATLQHLINTSIGEYWQITMKDGTAYAFQSDIPNQLIWVQDRFGNQITLNHNGGLVDQVVSPSGRTISLNYDSSNRITSAVDNAARTIGYAYNTTGTLSTVTYPDSTTEKYTYDSNNRMLTMQDRRGNVWVTNQYDTNGRVIKQTFADSTYYQFGYTTNSSNVVTTTTITDPNGNQEQVQFDPVSSYPSSDTHAYGTSLAQTTTYVREASGLVDSETDALGRITAFTYDAVGNVLSVTQLSGTSNAVTTHFTYTSTYNQLASVTDPLSNTTNFTYTNGCLTQITDALSHSTTIQCNTVGQPTAVQDALGHTALFAYQGYDLQSVTDALDRTTTFSIDALGRRIATRDPLGNVSLMQYDTNDRVTSVTDALNQATSFTYDGNGNPLTVTLPNQGVITATYDARNRRITHADAMSQSESWTYDGMSNVTSHTDRKGQLTQISYDALNRRGLISYADGSGIQATYDAGNRLTQLTDSVSGTYGWGYDGLDHVLSTTAPQGNVSYTYDADGRRVTMTPAAQATATYNYDNANRLTGITQGSETVQLAYDAANRRTMLTLPNGVTVNYGYDNANELTGLTYAQGNGTALGNLTYGYDNDGRRVAKTNSFNTDLLPTPTTQAPTFDLNDRETSFNGQALTYDANGNLTFDGTNTYTWNARNQLTQVSQNGNAQLTYSYDVLGRRTSMAAQGGTPTQYLYDGANAVQETQGGNVNPILVGLGVDERFARNDVTGRTYFLTDALNSTLALTDTTGAIRQQYSYDPYGNVTQSDTTSGFTNPYQYTGREADTAGLYYHRARYYSPMMASFISEDPAGFGGGQNSFYAYASGNPLDFTDPSGQGPIEAVVGMIIGGAYGYYEGKISHDCGANLRHDVIVGMVEGGLAGLTDGASLFEGGGLEWVTGALLRADISALGEEGRQTWNGGAVTDPTAVATNAFGSVLGSGIGVLGEMSQGGELSSLGTAVMSAATSLIGGAPSLIGTTQSAADAQINQMNQQFYESEMQMH